MSQPGQSSSSAAPSASAGRAGLIVLAWAWVGIPFLYGIYSLLLKVPALF